MTLKFTRDHLLFLFDLWWIGFIVLSFTGFNAFFVLTIVGGISLLLVPGMLTIEALRLPRVDFWTYISMAVGLSLLELISVGLFSNLVLPYTGIELRPLDTGPLLYVLTFFVSILASITWLRMKEETFSLTVCKGWKMLDFVLAFIPLLFVLMSIMGAEILNAGGVGTLTLSMLVSLALYSAALLYWSKNVQPGVIPTALFFVALSLLFMTSLRGYAIVGHDIQNEFRVFELARIAGVWTIASYQDAYNACMSITILPTLLANLLALPDPYVYKVLFQIIFAFVTTSVYLLARRYVSAAVALMAALYFVSFPTFFTDMPFLNRQEIAFLFLALMFLIGLDERFTHRVRQWLFVLFGAGVILSHYSTTYTVIALLLFLLVARPLLGYLYRFLPRALAHTTLANLQKEAKEKPFITWWMVGLLVGGSFFWSSVFTDTSSSSLYRVFTRTVTAMQSTFQKDIRSTDVLYSLFSWKKVDTAELFEEYKESARLRVAEAPPSTYYASTLVEKYDTPLIETELMPKTALGNALASTGLNVETFNYTVRQLSAKLLQLFMLVGILVVLYRREWFYRVPHLEFVLMGVGSLIILSAIIVLPVLSVEYGLLRAFQQSLMFLGLCIVIGSASIFFFLKERWQLLLAGAFSILFLLSSTGTFTQLLGGYEAQLHLNNAGPYYDLYYVHDSELQAIAWLGSVVKQDRAKGIETTIQGDHDFLEAASSLQGAYVVTDIYPALIRQDAYVFLGVSNNRKGKGTASYNQTAINYEYPIEFLEATKSRVYDGGDVKIYR